MSRNVRKITSARGILFGTVLIGTTFAGSAGRAGVAEYNLSGSGISGSISLSYAPNPNTGSLGTSPNAHDPVGSYVVTGITGTFSDVNIGLSNVLITGIVPSNPANPQSTNLLAPHSFGFYPIASGVATPGGTAPGLSYDNLFYPTGSPQTASDYPFHGGPLDIYGIVFTLAGGDAVDLWSNGDMGDGVTFGAGVTDGTSVLDYAQPLSMASVPEPATWSLMLLGFGAIGVAVRRGRNPRAINQGVERLHQLGESA